MISLTLLPGQGEAKVGPAYPIAGPSPPSASSPPSLQHRNSDGGSAIRLSFAARGRFKENSIEEAAGGRTSALGSTGDAKLRVRLAHDDLLVPFIERPQEVRELLFETDKNTNLIDTLRNLFSHTSDEWEQLQSLLCDTGRDQMGDRLWLKQLYHLIFPRSSTLWCKLVDCLGAHGLDWSTLDPDGGAAADEDETASMGFADVFSDGSSSFMTDKTSRVVTTVEVEALHEVPRTFRGPPTTVDRPSHHRQHGQLGEEARSSDQERHWQHSRTSSVIPTGNDDEVDGFLTNGSKSGFAGIRMSLPLRGGSRKSSHIRSASVPTHDAETKARSCRQLHQFTRHRRLSTLFTTMPAVGDEAEQNGTEQRGGGVKDIKPSSHLSRSLSVGKGEGERTLGLLPDGRTRHPSASNGPASKEAAALLAFKNELKLSNVAKAAAHHRSESWAGQDANNFAFSPPLSEDSLPTTVSPATSPEAPKQKKRLEPPSPSSMLSPTTTPRTHLIFPIPPSPHFSRSENLKQLLECKDNQAGVENVKSVIGDQRFRRLHTIVDDNDRAKMTDERLLEWIARDCFHLIDQEKESQEAIEQHLLDDEYEARWHAFVQLCHLWNVDNAVIRQAKRRCGPAVKLF